MNRFLRDFTFLAVAALFAAMPLQAASTDRFWNNTGTAGDFNDGANWDIDSPPVSPYTGPLVNGDTAYINNGGTANISDYVIPLLQYLYVNNGMVYQTTGNMSINGSVRMIGAGGGTGTYLMDGGSLSMNGLGADGLVYSDVNQFWGVGSGAGSTGTFTLNNYSVVSATGVDRIGDTGGTGFLNVTSGSTFQQIGTFEVGEGAGANGTVTLTGPGSYFYLTQHASYGGNVWVGDGGGTGTLTIQDHAKFYGDTGAGTTYFVIGNVSSTNTGSHGHLVISDASSTDSAQLTLGSHSPLYVAWGSNTAGQTCDGDITMTGYGSILSQANTYVGVYPGSTATWTMSGNTSASFATASYIGHAGSVATVTLSEYAQMIFGSDMQLGNSNVAGGMATMTLKDHALVYVPRVFVVGAAVTGSGNNTTGNLILEGNSQFIMAGGDTWLGNYQDGKGNITLRDNAYFETTGASIYYGGSNRASTRIGGNTTSTATPSSGNLNLEGGIFQTNYIMGTSAGTVNFKGGVLRASESTTTWLQTGVKYKVWAAGATLDTHSYMTTGDNISGTTLTDLGPVNVTVLGSLTEESTSTGGGLTVQGGGTLTLAGTNSYTGPTTIATNGGTVVLASATALPAHTTGSSGYVTINSGGTLSIAATSTLNGNITMNGGTLAVAAPNTTLGGQFSGTAGTVSIDSTGAAITGVSTYSGSLVVNTGSSLIVSGTLPAATTVGTAGSSTNALLGGTGTLGSVTLLPNSDTTAGQPGGTKGGLEAGQFGVGTLHTAALSITGPAFLYVGNDLTNISSYTGANVAFDANGALTLNTSGAATISIVNSDLSAPGALGLGTYHLIKHTGAIAGSYSLANILVANVSLSGRQTGIVMDNPGYLDFVVTGVLPVWTGKVGGTTTDDTWYASDLAKTNWQKTLTDTTPAYYVDTPTGDSVTFNDTGNGHLAVSIPANVSPTNVMVDSQYNYTFSGAGGIIGTGGLVKRNTGSLTINTPNAYSGGTTIYGGLVQLGNANALGAATGIVGFGAAAPSTAILRLNGNSITLGGLTTDLVTPGTPVVENGAASAITLTINNTVDNTYAGLLQDGGSGAMAVTFGGTANFTLNSANTYSGDTTINNGTAYVTLGVANALYGGAVKGNLFFGASGGNLDLNGSALTVNNVTSAGKTIITNKKLASTSTLTLANGDIAISLQNTGTGVLALAKNGSGTLHLRDPATFGGTASTYSGGTAETAGTIKTYYVDALGVGALTMSTGTTLDPQSATLNVRGLASSTTSAGVVQSTLSFNPVTLTLSPATGTTPSFSGLIHDATDGSALAVTKSGAGTQTLTASNDYSGATTITAGTLAVPTIANGGVSSPIGKSSADPSNLVLAGGLLSITGGSVTTNRGITTNGGGISVPTAATNVTFTSPIAANAAGAYFIKSGPGTVTFNASGFVSNDFGSFYNREVYNQGGTIVYTGTGRYDSNSSSGQEFVAKIFHTGTNYASSAVINNVTLRSTQVLTGIAFSSGYGSSASNGNLSMTGTAQAISTGIFVVGYTATSNATPIGVLTMSNSSYIDNAGRFFIGTNSGGASATGTVTLNDSAQIKIGADFLCGNSAKGVGTVNLHGDSFIDVGTTAYCGNGGSGTIGIYNLDGTAHINAGRTLTLATQVAEYIGNGATASGTVTLNGDGGLDPYITANGLVYVGNSGGTGVLTLNGNSTYTNTTAISTMRIGSNNATSSGTVNLNGTSQLAGNLIQLSYFGGSGILNANDSTQVTANNIEIGHNWNAAATDSKPRFNVNGTGAVVNVASTLIVGADGSQDTIWTQAGGTTTVASIVYLGEYDYSDAIASRVPGYGTLNLNGGVFTTPAISTHSVVVSTNAADLGATLHGITAGNVNFNGGILKTSADSADFIATDDPLGTMTLKVLSNGAKIDTNSFNVTITKPLATDLVSLGGGLTKLGLGTLTLTGALTYTGTTDIQFGTLQLYTPGSVALGGLTGTGSLTVGDGITANKVTLSGLATGSGAVLINATSELQLTAAGENTLGAVTGGGILTVRNGVNLSSPSITVDTLVIGGAPTLAAVPEPGTFMLLILAGLALTGAHLRRK